jgi:hypothetical protein
MVVDEAIQRFKDACALPHNAGARQHAVWYQINRCLWAIDDHDGRLTIAKQEKWYISIYNAIKAGGENKQPTRFEISKDQYDELEKIYVGDF